MNDVAYARFGSYWAFQAPAAAGLGRLPLGLRADSGDPDVCVLQRVPDADGPREALIRREAQLAARLEHENITRTFRVERIDGQLCLARELVEGVSLDKLMRQVGVRPLPLPVALHVAHDAARALGYAHDLAGLGITHRALAPETVLLSFAGDVKVMGFGLPDPRRSAAVEGAVVVEHPRRTAPELVAGAAPDRRADIYALGVMIWEMLTGYRVDETAVAGPDGVLPDPSEVTAEIPEGLGRLTRRALAPEPAARFQTAEELAAALAEFMPAGADPRRELADLLDVCFDVTALRAAQAAVIDGAQRFGRAQRAPVTERLRPATPPTMELMSAPLRPARRRAPLIAALVATVALIGGGITMLTWTSAGGEGRRSVGSPARPSSARTTAPIAWPPPAPPSTTAAEEDPFAASPPVQMPIASPPPAGPPGPSGSRQARRPTAIMTRPPLPASAAELLRQANGLWERGDTAAATARTRQALVAGAGAPAHVLLGAILINVHDYAHAQPELAAAIRLDPRNAEARRLLALVKNTTSESAESAP